MKKLVCSIVFVLPFCVFSQIIGTSAYIIGNSVEIGINDAGHEGAPFLAGSNNRSDAAVGSPTYFGFVANPQLDGWGDYNGDFFTPGSPENGFGLEIEGVGYSNNASGVLEEIEGSITGYEVDGSCISVIWDGSVEGIDMKVVYRLVTTELYYTTEVTLTNTGVTDYTDLYYYRNLDPDNNVTLSFDYTTQNTIVNQPIPGCEKALVTATQTAPWDSYIGLGAIGANFRVSHGGFNNRSGSDIWNGVAGLSGVVGSTAFMDQAISLAYKIDNLNVGDTETFLFTVVLDGANVDAAISSLYYFGEESLETASCSEVIDSTRVCVGEEVDLEINGNDLESFTWTWSPPVGLSTVDGPVTVANPLVSTEYLVTGVPIVGCVTTVIEKNIFVEVVDAPVIEIVEPGFICGTEFDLTTLEVNDLSGLVDPLIRFYNVEPDSIDQVVGLWGSDFIMDGEIVIVLLGDSVGGCFVTGIFEPDFGSSVHAGPDNATNLCNTPGTTADLTTYLTGADPGGVWTDVDGVGSFDPVTAIFDASDIVPGDYIFRYMLNAGVGCPNDTADVTVTVLMKPIIDAGPDQIICEGEITTVSGAGGEMYLWDNGAIDGLPIAPEITTTYEVVGMDASGCVNTDEMTIAVTPLPDVEAGEDQVICVGEEVVLSGTGDGTLEWSAGLVDGILFEPELGAMDYVLTVTDVNGCVNTDEVNVLVGPLPNVSAADDFVICDGTAITLTGVGAAILAWDSGVEDGVEFIPDVTSTYTLTGVDEIGCVNTDQIIVTVSEIPVFNFEGDVLTGCYPLAVTFTNLNPIPGEESEWLIEDNVIIGDVITYVFKSAGCFDITLGGSVGVCYGGTTYFDYICIDEYPVADFLPDPMEVSSENTYTEMINSSIGATTYEWDFGDGTNGITGEEPGHVYPLEAASYEITLIAYSPNLCEAKATSRVIVREELVFYVPNAFTPDGDDFNEAFRPVFASGLDIYDYHLTVFNRWGEILFESFNVENGWDGTYGDGDVVPNGTYLWQIEFGDINNDKTYIERGHVNLLK